jgi:hypothetical protein
MSKRWLILALLVALAAVPAGTGAAPVNVAPAKAKKCKKGKVKVKVGKRVSCVAARKALPKPKAGDQRLLLAKSAVGTDWSRLRNRRGKRAQSLPKLIRKVGARAPALLSRATSRGLARLDALAARSSSASAHAAASGCDDVPRGARERSSFTSNGGDGTSATVTATLGAEGAGMVMQLSGHGFSVKLDLDFGACEPDQVEAPDCPTAVGKLEGKIRYKLRVAIEVTKDGEDVWSQVVDVTRTTKLEGWTDTDAKLDRLDVEDVETSNFTLGGSVRGYPPISIRTRIVRKTQVDMRSGAYEPDRSDISVTVATEGLSGPDRADVEDDIAERSRARADEQFRAIVKKAIDGYRTREEAWQQPKKCAKLQFSPAPNTRTLRPGQGGSFTATAIAQQGGGASELDAKLSNQLNASFSPTRAGGQSARFDYTVASAAPAGGKVRATVRATSKAGVDEETWEQPLQPPFTINKIAGNFSGSYSQPVGPRTGMISWSGSATFERQIFPGTAGAFGNYVLKAGQVNFTYSGGSIAGDALCDMSGTAFADLFQHGGGSIGVTPVGTSIFEAGPHNYGASATVGPTPRVTITESNCADPMHNGTTHDLPLPIQALDTGQDQQLSPDGTHYDGSYSKSQSGISYQWTWVLTGSE